MDPRYTKAGYILDSSTSGISLDLDADDTSSMVTLVKWNLPKLDLSSYTYMDVTITGIDNALLRIWFYLADGCYITSAYKEDVGTVAGRLVDLAPYTGRRLNGAGFIELMSGDGLDSSVDITEIALVA
jgi:hypothetical protein